MMTTQQQIAPIYHRRIGDVVITALSDGVVVRTNEMMNEISKEQGDEDLAASFRRQFMLSINSFLVQSGNRLALVDTGCGEYLGAECGRLLANMKAAGVTPDSIDTVLLTHMHPDHSAGLTDMKTGSANFPNAELVVHHKEPEHWYDDAEMARGSERQKKLMFRQAREQCAPYQNRLRTFTSAEVFPDVTAVPCHGHTPGHCGFMLESAGEALLIWVDTVHMPEVQVLRPEVTMTVDVDPAAAEASRRRIFDMVAADRLLVTGMHLHFPGFGHIAKEGNSYRYVAEPWVQVL